MNPKLIDHQGWWFGLSLDDVKYLLILDCLARHNHSRPDTAKELGISQRRLYRYIKQMRDAGIEVKMFYPNREMNNLSKKSCSIHNAVYYVHGKCPKC